VASLKWREGFFVFTPYYRPMWGTGGGARGWGHEAGLLVKWAYGKHKDD